MTLPKNIFFVGATGGLGHIIALELLKNKHFHVKVLVRKDTLHTKREAVKSLKRDGAHIIEGFQCLSHTVWRGVDSSFFLS